MPGARLSDSISPKCMRVSVIKIRRLAGSKRISRGAAALGYHLLSGGSLLMTSAATRATPTSCAAWASSHELKLRRLSNGRPHRSAIWCARQSEAATALWMALHAEGVRCISQEQRPWTDKKEIMKRTWPLARLLHLAPAARRRAQAPLLTRAGAAGLRGKIPLRM